jgi:hypothetical protein
MQRDMEVSTNASGRDVTLISIPGMQTGVSSRLGPLKILFEQELLHGAACNL